MIKLSIVLALAVGCAKTDTHPSTTATESNVPWRTAARIANEPPSHEDTMDQPTPEPRSNVIINGTALSIEHAQASAIPDGRYWYDARSGLWGGEGMPVQGQIQPGLASAPLAPNASHGTTNVFVNGRNLPAQEVAWLEQLLRSRIAAGRYWLDAQGNVGYEGGGAVANLVVVARRNHGGGDNFWAGRAGAGNESGGAGYVCTGGTCATYGM